MNETSKVDKFIPIPYKRPLLGEDLFGGGEKLGEEFRNLGPEVKCSLYWYILMKTPVYSSFMIATPSGIRSEPSGALPDKSKLGQEPLGFKIKETTGINLDFMLILDKALEEGCPWAEDILARIEKIKEELKKNESSLKKSER